MAKFMAYVIAFPSDRVEPEAPLDARPMGASPFSIRATDRATNPSTRGVDIPANFNFIHP